jgi:hypothetical protein
VRIKSTFVVARCVVIPAFLAKATGASTDQ